MDESVWEYLEDAMGQVKKIVPFVEIRVRMLHPSFEMIGARLQAAGK